MKNFEWLSGKSEDCSYTPKTKCLTLVDSRVVGLPVLLEAMNAKTNLETLVVIYNVETHFEFEDDQSDDELVEQLLEAGLN